MIKEHFNQRKKERCQSGPFLNIVSHNKRVLIWVLIFLTLFTTGSRYDVLISLISSSICVLVMALFEQLIRKILIPKFLSRDHHQLHYYLTSFLIIYVLVWGTVSFERLVFTKFMQSNLLNLTIKEDLTNVHRVIPFLRMGVLLIGTFSISTISFLLSRTKAAYKISDNLRNEKLEIGRAHV